MFNFDMVVFMQHVSSGNWFLDAQHSSLTNLLGLLGGIPARNAPFALRQRDENTILNAIMGTDAAGTGGIRLAKRQRYKNALAYLVHQMNLPPAQPAGPLRMAVAKRLVTKDHREIKVNWLQGHTVAGDQVITCTGVAPARISAAGGFDPRFSTEFCTANVIDPPAAPWAGHEFCFFFERRRNNAGVWDRLRPLAANDRMGFVEGYIYLIRPVVGTTFMTPNGAILPASEVAFPQRVPLAQILPYRWSNNVATQLTWAGRDAAPADIVAI